MPRRGGAFCDRARSIELLDDNLTCRDLQRVEIVAQRLQCLAAVVDEGGMHRTARQSFKTHSARPGKKVENVAIVGRIAQNIKNGLADTLGGWPRGHAWRCAQDPSTKSPGDNSHAKPYHAGAVVEKQGAGVIPARGIGVTSQDAS